MWLAAVESANDLLAQPIGFRRVFRFDHSFGKRAKFLPGEHPAFIRVANKLSNPIPFFSRQALDLPDNFNRCHGPKLLAPPNPRKVREPRIKANKANAEILKT